MRAFEAVILSVALVAGCGGPAKSAARSGTSTPTTATGDPTADPIEALLARIALYRDQTCACADHDCAARAMTDQETWQREHQVGERLDRGAWTLTAAQDEQAMGLVREASQCAARFEPKPDPDVNFADALETLGGLTDRLCACADAACRTEVGNAIDAWLSGAGKRYADQRPTPAENDQLAAIMQRTYACR